MTIERSGEQQMTAVIKEALLVKVVAMTGYFRRGQTCDFDACIRIPICSSA